jgi:glutamate dehydrogenase (NAD(P)+)
MSDKKKALVAEGGLEIDDLRQCIGDKRALSASDYRGPGKFIDRDALFDREAELLVLGAASHSVGAAMAGRIVAPTVVEASNFGLTPDARRVLQENGKAVVPDVIASSSSAAMVCHQMVAGNTMDPEDLWSLIEGAIDRNTRSCLTDGARLGIDPRDAFVQSFGSGRD